LKAIDPHAADRIHPNDPQRLQRALEVYELTGEPLSELQKNTKSPLPIPPVKFALIPEQRSWLHDRIEQRFKIMLDDGFIDEVKGLVSQFDLSPSLPSMRSVGYRQAIELINGHIDESTMLEKAVAATRQLAKRQLTWLRSMDELNTVSCDTLHTEQQVDLIDQAMRSL